MQLYLFGSPKTLQIGDEDAGNGTQADSNITFSLCEVFKNALGKEMILILRSDNGIFCLKLSSYCRRNMENLRGYIQVHVSSSVPRPRPWHALFVS